MLKLLIVDDAKVMREMINVSLVNEGFEVFMAKDGVEAFEMARKNQVDMVLSDINMPNMDGVELVSKLRSLTEYKTIPILMLTTESSGEIKAHAKEMGADGWLQKPVDPTRLIKAVNTMLAKAGHVLEARS